MAECRFRPPRTREEECVTQRYSEVTCSSSPLKAGVDNKLLLLELGISNVRDSLGRKFTAWLTAN